MAENLHGFFTIFDGIVTPIGNFEESDEDNQHHDENNKNDIQSEYMTDIAECTKCEGLVTIGEKPQNTEFLSLIFDGRFENFTEWSINFQKMIHNQESLSDEQKLSYLKLVLTDDVLTSINLFVPSPENYQSMWEGLHELYSNKSALVARHVKYLIQLPKQRHETAAGLVYLIREVVDHVRFINTLDVDVKFQAVCILMEAKLHANTLEALSREHDSKEYPSLEYLLDFMARRVTELVPPEAYQHWDDLDTDMEEDMTYSESEMIDYL
uniref:Uncharacterized protein n=1 Tax=Bracon brevicornis TaxID=1563983 RepID=A0A6V7HPB8_9HYME